MGFSARRAYTLKFRENDPLTDGLVVEATAPSVDETLTSGAEEAERRQAAKADPAKAETTQQVVERSLQQLAEHLVSWNVTDDKGKAIQPTYAGLKKVDWFVARRILEVWQEIGRTPEETSPLGNGSGGSSTTSSTTGPDPRIEASIQSQAMR
jgi:hypothetical protein